MKSIVPLTNIITFIATYICVRSKEKNSAFKIQLMLDCTNVIKRIDCNINLGNKFRK